MKRIFKIIFLLMITSTFAQFTAKVGGIIMTDGYVVSVGTTSYPENDKSFSITNTSSSIINVRLGVVSFTNTDGTNLQVCIGNCVNGVTAGQSFPNPGHITLNPGQTTANNSILVANFDAGNGSQIIDYNLKFYQVDGSSNEIGTPINFTYRFDPNLSAQNFDTLKNIGIQIENTLVNQDFKILATQNTTIALYDINGRALVQSNLKVGENVINVQNLTSGMYVASFSTEDGKTATAKIMVK